ncbi:hypothetical protein LguiA_005528 [Lonicera macranthoides]
MVWGLFPADPLSGEDKYYVFSKGTYKVGRRGCDVIINKDKGVSRIHAEIVIEEMISLDNLQKKSSNISSKVQIRDCSKYGTFINKNLGSKEKVHEFPNRETTLKDGDMVSFGTGNATYRFSFVPIIFLNLCSEPVQANQVLKSSILSIGATITCNWSPDCTHVLVDDFMLVKEHAFDAIVAKKPLILQNWVVFIAEKGVCTDIPSCNSYAPTLKFEGLSVKVADPRSRECCLRGYTFLLESTHKYKLRDRLQSLLEVAGAKVAPVEGFYPTSQGTEHEGSDRVVHVIPGGSADSSQYVRQLCRVNEINLICATLSGHLDPSIIVSPPVVVSSSCSTDETVVADSDVEMETAASVCKSSAAHEIESNEHEMKEETSVHTLQSVEHTGTGEMPFHTIESLEYQRKRDISSDCAVDKSKSDHVLRDGSESMIGRVHKVEDSESENVDIIFSQDLIVRDTYVPASVNSSINGAVINFKRFRKMGTESGNSFENLIPFSKDPYRDGDYENDEKVAESIKEEKRRKQMEAVAEDLFNNEKGRRRSAAGSLHGFLIRN